MLRVLARDVIREDGTPIEGWEAWIAAVADGALFSTVLWPAMLAMLLDEDRSYTSWDATYAHADRHQVVALLRTREWDALAPSQRLDLLCWLSDNTSQSITVRYHLERNWEASAELRRERRQVVDEEASREAALQKIVPRIEQMERRLAEWDAQVKSRAAQRKKPLGEPPDFDAELAMDRARRAEEEGALERLRARRLAIQTHLDSMPLRSEPLGADRYGRTYVALGGAPAAAGLAVHIPDTPLPAPVPTPARKSKPKAAAAAASSAAEAGASAASEAGDEHPDCGGSWAWIEGAGPLRQLFHSLHMDGIREGGLLSALRRHRLCAVLGGGGATAGAGSGAAFDGAAAGELPPHPSHPIAPTPGAPTGAAGPDTGTSPSKAALLGARGGAKGGAAPEQQPPFGYRGGGGDGAPPTGQPDEGPLEVRIAAMVSRLEVLADAVQSADGVADAGRNPPPRPAPPPLLLLPPRRRRRRARRRPTRPAEERPRTRWPTDRRLWQLHSPLVPGSARPRRPPPSPTRCARSRRALPPLPPRCRSWGCSGCHPRARGSTGSAGVAWAA